MALIGGVSLIERGGSERRGERGKLRYAATEIASRKEWKIYRTPGETSPSHIQWLHLLQMFAQSVKRFFAASMYRSLHHVGRTRKQRPRCLPDFLSKSPFNQRTTPNSHADTSRYILSVYGTLALRILLVRGTRGKKSSTLLGDSSVRSSWSR